jgi:A/G-specific adenine glycosylase
LPAPRRVGGRGFFCSVKRRSRGRQGERALNESQFRDRRTPEIGIDSRTQGAALMLQKQGGGRFGLEREHAARWSFDKLDRPRKTRRFRTRDFRPTQDERRIDKSGTNESSAGRERCIRSHGDGSRVTARRQFGLFVLGRLRHARSMPRETTPKQKRKAGRATRLLAWYDVHRRALPWRAAKGQASDPYRVWLSEIMLQQTTVQAVSAYYAKFLKAWPTVRDLADASQDEVLTAWAGLGYYARARNLHAAAKRVAYDFGGQFPETAEGMRALPGIGEYTSGAIAAIAFDRCEPAVDANAERVLSRLFAVAEAMPKAKPLLRQLCRTLVPERRAGDFAQALMDLGSLVCTPKRPRCGECPWSRDCEARRRGIQEDLPRKAMKAARPLKRGAAFVARNGAGEILLVKRAEKGLLGGMMQPPLGPWNERFPSAKEALLQAPFRASWRKLGGIVRHGFTHFELELEVYVADVSKRSNHGDASARWVRDLSTVALPTVMKKIIGHAINPESNPNLSVSGPAGVRATQLETMLTSWSET